MLISNPGRVGSTVCVYSQCHWKDVTESAVDVEQMTEKISLFFESRLNVGIHPKWCVGQEP